MSISKKVYLGMASLVVLLVVSGLITAFLTFGLKTSFSEYRSTARASLLANDVAEDVFEARIAGLKYRATGADRYVTELAGNLDEVRETQIQLQEIAQGTTFLDEVNTIPASVDEYQSRFESAVALQGFRNEVVASMSTTGRKAREQLSEIMLSAFRDGDPGAAYVAGQAVSELLLGRLYAERFLVTNQTDDFETAIGWLNDGRERMDQLFSELQNPRRRELAQATVADLGEFIENTQRVAEVITERNANYAAMDAVGPVLLSSIETIVDTIKDRQNTLGPSVTSRSELTLYLVIGIALFGAIAGSIGAVMIGRSISGPIADVTDDISTMADGNLDIEVRGQEDNFEIGQMARAMEVFRKTALEARDLAKQQELVRQADVERAKKNEKRLENERGIAKQVSASAGTVNGTAAEFKSIANDMAKRTEASAMALDNTSTDVEGLLKSISTVVENTRSVDKSMENVKQGAEYGSSVADSTKEAMKEMADASALIENVTSVIEDIAFQINLLSLNAGVEAARAGEAGRGFTVVAAEVRALAQRSQDAVQEINKVIAENGKSVKRSVEQVNKSQEALEAIIKDVAIASSQIADINNAVEEQSTGMEGINSLIRKVRDSAQSDAASIEELSASSVTLSEEAERLSDTVSLFGQENESTDEQLRAA